ncbi:hypothetical protein VP01_10169g1, partial [Puccinia sorghi]
LDWPQPTSVKTLQGFLVFANSYWKFIKNDLKTIINLTSILRKDTPFIFTEQSSKEFKALRKPLLAYGSNSRKFHCRHHFSLHNSELNYEIHENKLLEIFFCLKKWCSYLLSLSEPFAQWFWMLYHIKTTFTPERRPLPITNLIIFKQFFPP